MAHEEKAFMHEQHPQEEHGCGCGHEHEHDHDHGYGHDHDHDGVVGHHQNHGGIPEHAHNAAYTHTLVHRHLQAGHPQDCTCDACEDREVLCDWCGQDLAHCLGRRSDAPDRRKLFVVENLDCSLCAAQMEGKLKQLPGVSYASVTYPARVLSLTAKNPDELLPVLNELCRSIDSAVTVRPLTGEPASSATVRTYDIAGLDCAFCAQKVEASINSLPEVQKAVLTFATGRLEVQASNWTDMTARLQEAADAVEEGTTIREHKDGVLTAGQRQERLAAASLLGGAEAKRELAVLWVGAVLFVLTEFTSLIPDEWKLAVQVTAYLVLGFSVLKAAVRNIFQGAVFDENFLMAVATLGAFAIGANEESIGVMLFYRVGEFFQERAAERSRNQIMAAVDMRPETVQLIQGDEVATVPAASVKPGDVLLVRAGDRIPLDGVVLEGESMLDTSPVTGEPVPVRKRAGDEILSGCVNTSGMLKIRVEKELKESMVTKILDSVENAAASKPRVDRFITRFAKVYTPVVVAAAIFVALVPSLITGHWRDWIYTALTFLVISCPCALVLSVPLSFFAGIGAGSRLGILFKGGNVLEQLKRVQAVILDKTGTLTEGIFALQESRPAAGTDARTLLAAAAGAEQVSTHPIALSVVRAAQQDRIPLLRPDRFEEIAGCGLVASYGSSQVLVGNTKLLDRYGVSYDGYMKTDAGSEVLVAKDGSFLGSLVIRDSLKGDTKEAMAALRRRGLVTVMLTGDDKREAAAVAAEAGVQEFRSELLPQDKVKEMKLLRNKYGSVCFVGDGINDAPVLAGADVGAAMGSGADAALEAADVVFMNSEMNSVPRALRIADAVNRIAWQNIVFAIAVKVLILAAGLFGYANMWAAIFADTGVSILCVLNSCRILYKKY